VSDTYQLKHPIVLRTRVQGGEERQEEITEVPIRRLKSKDLRMLDRTDGSIAKSLSLIGALTGLSGSAVDELDLEDIEGLGEIVGGFFPGRQETGETF
jgi:hypothetical protein